MAFIVGVIPPESMPSPALSVALVWSIFGWTIASAAGAVLVAKALGLHHARWLGVRRAA